MIGSSGVFILFTLTIVTFILLANNVEECGYHTNSFLGKLAFVTSINLTLKAFFNKACNNGFKSQTFKLLRFVLMVLGLVSMSYYRAMLNAALNVDTNEITIKSWKYLANSDYKLLIYMGTLNEDIFKYGDDIKRKIHKEKILTVSPELQLQNLGMQGGVEAIINGKYLGLDNILLYKAMKEYPCKIIEIPSPELR